MENPTVAKMIDDYAHDVMADDFPDNEGVPPLFLAISDASCDAERRALGLALCTRYDAMTGGEFLIRGEKCDPRLTAIADGLGYQRAD
ncbi:hypothetical protein [Thalassobaculum litoreum]|uniref:Uncharacterized protein n=1 Tax=Thalassobaculum litoreum DSM 18839 TaxID=1123362 RepID=A0A8G2BI09_9PROT|nr:hypothetical protein [Thalassobaculum litoreum]SDF83149.1 hypothetical protein SAMN05660686_02452 [Thalassobaculum litoreum DSM 18839]